MKTKRRHSSAEDGDSSFQSTVNSNHKSFEGASPQRQHRNRHSRRCLPQPPPQHSDVATDDGDCFVSVTRDLTVPVYPWQLSKDAGALVAEHLRSQLHRHVASLGGILHSIASVHLLTGSPGSSADAAGRHRLAAPIVSSGPSLVQFPVRARLACRLFRPRPGSELPCRVTAVLPDLLSCVCHRVYQVTVTLSPTAAPALEPGDRILARVSRLRTHSRQQVSIEAEFVCQLSE